MDETRRSLDEVNHLADSELDLAVIVPVYRNASTLETMVGRLNRALAPTGLKYQLVFVDDDSPDDAWRVIQMLAERDSRVSGLLLAANQGQHMALLAGMAHLGAKWVAVLDADLQDPPELLPSMVSVCEQENVTVFARRQGRYQSAGRMLTSRVFKSLLGRILNMPSDIGTCFVVPAHVAERMCKTNLRHPQVVVMARVFSPGWKGIFFQRSVREAGVSAYSGWGRMQAALRSLCCAIECRFTLARHHSADDTGRQRWHGVIAAKINL